MAAPPTPLLPPPPPYAGLWRRTGIWRKDADGAPAGSDVTTRVWWFQSSRFHVDLRIPLDRPQVEEPAALAGLSPRQLARFAAQSGFAGATVVSAERCEWRPEIAFPAVGADLDAGFMRFDTPDNLHETGIDGSYDEDWVRVATGPVLGLRLEAIPASGERAYLLVSDGWAAWGCGYPDAAFPADCAEFSLLRKHGGGAWRVAASTCAWLEGGAAFDAAPLSLELARLWAPGDVVTLARQWRVTDVATPE